MACFSKCDSLIAASETPDTVSMSIPEASSVQMAQSLGAGGRVSHFTDSWETELHLKKRLLGGR